ncbi:CIC11C00000001904 [Sungouiella intermedia]|uniref:CIC11C00000001904 n=1 Tax=Sungouiella intermedia TaxID=45354 RepID=A0A1L0B9A1_9ASCO|nr:CIC11C00000001904 [[Candida] intermedia]
MKPDTPTDAFEFGGRSYILMSHRASVSYNSPIVVSGVQLHQETADLASVGIDASQSPSDHDSPDEYVLSYPPMPIEGHAYGSSMNIGYGGSPDADSDSTTPLVDRNKKFYAGEEGSRAYFGSDLESGLVGLDLVNEASLNLPAIEQKRLAAEGNSSRPNFAVRAASYLPAVFLGTLLNVLDGLSYGMIMFPLGEAIFSGMAPSGLSMFYISTVISQLVYSLGGSAFKSGIGSEMIEVTPFFHSMALSINAEMNGQSKEAILATVIVTYAISSVVTGIIFLLLGKLKLGSLVGFFPRHILVGCIGGVGYFLVVTGVEVSSRLEGGLRYNIPTLEFLFGNYITLLQWTVPLLLTVILILLHQRIHNSLLVPIFFIGVFVAFHIIVAAVTGWDLQKARDYGWVFPAVEDKEPWYSHYKLFRFNLVDWLSIAKQFPSMMALTFFGILHVPINVPALAVTVGMDQCDVDRELVAHGYSNMISGFVGSIQNYLVYTNSVLFIRAGADDRLAGVMLAIATAGVMITGPVVIGYIPVCVVGSLIYLLGYELLKEAVWDTWGKLKLIEYSTIIIIVVVMGAWDFVYGVLVGILLACLSFVVEAARRPVVNGIYTGVVARSTVLRHPKQQDFLKDVGNQICVIKLQGTVFFGSIGGVEATIRERFERGRFHKNPIKYLIIDMKGVSSIDFSAAEGFRRILNLTNEFGTQLIISSVDEDDEIVTALRDAGLFDTSCELEIQLFNTLNYALEWCENSFLKTYRTLKTTEPKQIQRGSASSPRTSSPSSGGKLLITQALDGAYATPRTNQVYQAAKRTVKDEQFMQNKFYSQVDSSFKKQPLPLIMITFSGLSDKDETFWATLAPYFIKEKIPGDITFYDTGANSPSFFLIESGLVRSICKFESDDRELHSSILPNTAFGDLLELSQYRSITYTTVSATVAWRLSQQKVNELKKSPEGQAVFNELLLVQTKLFKERFDTLTANLVISA